MLHPNTIRLAILAALAALPFPSEAIVGGAQAAQGEIPFMVSLGTSSHACGAILVSSSQILTHPSCVEDVKPERLRARIGSSQANSGGLLSSISSVDVHSGYTASGPDRELNGIALLALTKSVPVDIATPVTIPPLDLIDPPAPASGTSLKIAGWGVTSSGSSSLPANLLRTNINALATQSCFDAYPELTLNNQTFCAGVLGGGKSACAFDTGGPVMNADGALVGIISPHVNGRCANSAYPDVYTNLAYFGPWLTDRLVL